MPSEGHHQTSPSRPRARTARPTSPPFSSSSPKRHKAAHVNSMASSRAMGKLPDPIDLTQEPPSGFQPYSGAKKLVIKNLRASTPGHASQVEAYYAKAQSDLGEALEAIFAGKDPAIPYERLYSSVENLCRKNLSRAIHRLVKDKIETHLQRTVLPRIRRDGAGRNFDTLKSVLAEWKTWNLQIVCRSQDEHGTNAKLRSPLLTRPSLRS